MSIKNLARKIVDTLAIRVDFKSNQCPNQRLQNLQSVVCNVLCKSSTLMPSFTTAVKRESVKRVFT